MSNKGLLWAAIAMLVILFTAEGYAIHQVRQAVQIAHEVQCASKHQAQKQLRESKTFLARNPDGAFGFTAQEIRKGIKDDELRLVILRRVKC